MWLAGPTVMATSDNSIIQYQNRAYGRIGTRQSNCTSRFIQSDAHEAFIAFDNSHEMNIAANSNW